MNNLPVVLDYAGPLADIYSELRGIIAQGAEEGLLGRVDKHLVEEWNRMSAGLYSGVRGTNGCGPVETVERHKWAYLAALRFFERNPMEAEGILMSLNPRMPWEASCFMDTAHEHSTFAAVDLLSAYAETFFYALARNYEKANAESFSKVMMQTPTGEVGVQAYARILVRGLYEAGRHQRKVGCVLPCSDLYERIWEAFVHVRPGSNSSVSLYALVRLPITPEGLSMADMLEKVFLRTDRRRIALLAAMDEMTDIMFRETRKAVSGRAAS